MKATDSFVGECVTLLVKTFPVEDIWFLDSSAAKECHLDTGANLVVIVSAGSEASRIETEATALIGAKVPPAPVGVHVFPQSAMFQTPRPLLVKMAFTGGSHIYCG